MDSSSSISLYEHHWNVYTLQKTRIRHEIQSKESVLPRNLFFQGALFYLVESCLIKPRRFIYIRNVHVTFSDHRHHRHHHQHQHCWGTHPFHGIIYTILILILVQHTSYFLQVFTPFQRFPTYLITKHDIIH